MVADWLAPWIEFHECSECGDTLIRNWEAGDYYCQRCGLVF